MRHKQGLREGGRAGERHRETQRENRVKAERVEDLQLDKLSSFAVCERLSPTDCFCLWAVMRWRRAHADSDSSSLSGIRTQSFSEAQKT